MTKNKKIALITGVSGILLGLTYYFALSILVWFSLLPMLLTILTLRVKRVFLWGYWAGIFQGAIMYYWIVNVVNTYTGINNTLSFIVFLISILYQSLYLAVFYFIFYKISKRINHTYIIVITCGISWFVIEYFKSLLFGNSFPLFSYPLSLALAKNIYSIQISEIIGMWGLSFIIVIVNLLFTYALYLRKFVYAIIGLSIILLNYMYGFLTVNYNNNIEYGQSIGVAIISENIEATTRWNENTGDSLVSIFFDLNKQAVKMNPDLILWSESAIPWTYEENDPFISEIIRMDSGNKVWNIIGMLTKVDTTDRIYNSAYLINPDGIVVDRYDKMELLNGLEKEFIPGFENTKLSFLGESVANNIVQGDDRIFYTDFGKVGVRICNEVLIPNNKLKYIQEKVNLLVILSNDSWFVGTQVPLHHFLFIRFRAVENRIPVVVNSNKGVSGIISPVGKILLQEDGSKATVDYKKIRIKK